MSIATDTIAVRHRAVDANLGRSGAHKELRFDPWTIAAFLYPLSLLVVFEIVGQLFLMDVLALPLLLVMLTLPDSTARLRRAWPLFALATVWLLGQVLTDLVRGSAPQDYLRGWAKIIFFTVQVAALALAPRRRASSLLSRSAWALRPRSAYPRNSRIIRGSSGTAGRSSISGSEASSSSRFPSRV